MLELRFVGRCRRCGDCCRLMCKSAFMLGPDGVCKYLEASNLCAIRRTPRAERGDLPPEDIDYYERNCIGFPRYMTRQNPERLLEYLQRIGWPTDDCGYTLEVGDGE